jgi:hypothetical protein
LNMSLRSACFTDKAFGKQQKFWYWGLLCWNVRISEWQMSCQRNFAVHHSAKGKQCTCNITLRGVPITIVAVEKQYLLHILMCVCSLSYLVCQAHAHYHTLICGLSVSTMFFHIFSQKAWFLEIVIEHEICVLTFSTIFVWNM